MSCEGIDLFQTYYKYKDWIYSETYYTTLSNFRHVDFKHKLQDKLFISGISKEFTDEEVEGKIDNLVDFLNLHGHKIKIEFMIEKKLSFDVTSNTVARINEILSRTTSNLLYVSIVTNSMTYLVHNKFKFPLRMKFLDINISRYIPIIYSKLFIDTDVEEYPCLIVNSPMRLMLPEKYIDYTKITSLITRSFISPKNNLDLYVNLRNLCIDVEKPRCLKNLDDLQRGCFEPYTIFKKMECLMLWHTRYCDCGNRQIDHIPYYYLITRGDKVKFKRNRIIKKK